MRKCPYCGAKIEENAKICLYCMKELEEKVILSDQPRPLFRKWAWLLVLILAVAAAVGVFLALPKEEAPKAEETVGQEEAEDPSKEEEKETPASPGQEDGDSQRGDFAIEQESNVPQKPSSSNKQEGSEGGKTPASSALSGGSTEEEESPPQGESGGKAEEPSDSTDEKEEQPVEPPKQEPEKEPEPTPTAAVYTWRDAEYAKDDYHVTANVDNCVVITGVSTPASDGIYRIPETLGGKRVIAIKQSAFNGEGVRDTVRAVYLPSSVRTVQANAFSACYNLTDIYFSSKSIYVDPWAFAAKDRRSGTLNIHCAYDCNNRDLRYYRNIAESYYDAQFKEWNG